MSLLSTKQAALLIASLTSFMMNFANSAVNIALPSIGTELALDAVMLSWISTSTILASSMLLVPFGRLADTYGRKRLYIYGMCSFTFSSFLAFLSGTAMMLMVSRILQGIASASIAGTGVALLTSVFPAEERGKVLGINVTAVHTGVSLGPYLGGLITQQFGWRSIFLVTVPIGILIIILLIWKLPGEWAEAKGEKFDIIGSTIYGLILLLIVSGFSILPSSTGVLLIILAIGCLLLFIKWEMTVDTPILDLSLIRRNRVFAIANLTALVKFIATYGISFLLSMYLQYIKGLSPQNAGLVLLAQPGIQAVLSMYTGRLSDRIEPMRVVSFGMAIQAIGLTLFVFVTDTTSLAYIIVSLIILGLGNSLFSTPTTNAIMGSVERRYYGVASGMRSTMRLVGNIFNMAIILMIFNLYLGRTQITPDRYPLFSHSMHVAFVVFAVVSFVGFIIALSGVKFRHPAEG